MNFKFLKRKKFWKRLILAVVLVPIFLFFLVVTIAYYKQDAIVKELLSNANKDFNGSIQLRGSHIAPFANFPYISIDLEDLELFEGKSLDPKNRILHFKDRYIGFNLFDILSGDYVVKSLEVADGELRVIQHDNGDLNILKALESKKSVEEVKSDLHLNLQSIELQEIDISKLNESNGLLVDAYVTRAKSSFKTTNEGTKAQLSSAFEVSILKNGDTTFIKHKHFELDTDVQFIARTKTLHIDETEIKLEKSNFLFHGDIGLTKDIDLDLFFTGSKPNFDLFLALAPPALAPTLEQFDNKGTIYFDLTVKGKSGNGHKPAINGKFGCKHGYFNNINSRKKLEEIAFKGSFTNGAKRDISTMKFELQNFKAKPEAGIFSGKLVVENFEAPKIDMGLHADFDLDFLAKFINSRELKGVQGKVMLTMNFRDIIDLDHPEKSLEKLNESYYSKLNVQNLRFQVENSHLAINDLDINATLNGHKTSVDHLNLKMGNSDIQMHGFISDLPAIIHHTNIPVETNLTIHSKLLDLQDLTARKGKKGVDEQIENLSLKLKFLSSARNIIESKNLPKGEFFIDDFYAKMKHYPHTLHDFHADFYIDENDFRVVDFSGLIDKSDFHFSGKLENYAIWFEDKIRGDTKVEFDLSSKQLQFDNLFAYGGENFVPEDYRHEEAKALKLHGYSELHFNETANAIDLKITELSTKLKVHPIKFEDFHGRMHLENKYLTIEKMGGKMGHSNFTLDLGYYYGDDNTAQKPNFLSLNSGRLDFDELMNFHEKPVQKQSSEAQKNNQVSAHDNVFSIYDFQFPEMKFNVNITHLNYHNYLINNFSGDLRTEKNHMLFVEKLNFDAAGGHISVQGYFSGKDKEHIYFKPKINVRHLDLDKFMVKFDNFGQDHLVAENLHGQFSGTITGKLHMHADLVPKLDDSELTIDMQVLNGRLENYGPILAMSDFFQDKNLSKVLFDTLSNKLTLYKGVLNIPTMTINSSLGFLEVTGNQHINGKMNMDYIIGVPWKMIGDIAAQKLFRKRKEAVSEDEIVYRDAKSRMVYVKIIGDLENYKINLSKKPKKK